ncbi:hypothetical protein [uncultured Enterovirga sp.]|uniref:hypothetical protein n=1 Tax=uncultured Enterovirga sp. TaxID=2026352 RepID=UPI0035CBB369
MRSTLSPSGEGGAAFAAGIVGVGTGDFIRFRRGTKSYTLESLTQDRPEMNRLRVTLAGKKLLKSRWRRLAA